jgi:hypothetical protein
VHSRFPARQHTSRVYDDYKTFNASLEIVHPVAVPWLTVRFCGGMPRPITIVITAISLRAWSVSSMQVCSKSVL